MSAHASEGPLDVGVRLLDGRLPGWGFPRWGSEAAAGLDLHACLDAPLDLAVTAAAGVLPYVANEALKASRGASPSLAGAAPA